MLYLFHYKRIPNHFRGSVSGILSQNIHGGVGCPTISQVWDIQNYFYSWRFGGMSDENYKITIFKFLTLKWLFYGLKCQYPEFRFFLCIFRDYLCIIIRYTPKPPSVKIILDIPHLGNCGTPYRCITKILSTINMF